MKDFYLEGGPTWGMGFQLEGVVPIRGIGYN